MEDDFAFYLSTESSSNNNIRSKPFRSSETIGSNDKRRKMMNPPFDIVDIKVLTTTYIIEENYQVHCQILLQYYVMNY